MAVVDDRVTLAEEVLPGGHRGEGIVGWRCLDVSLVYFRKKYYGTALGETSGPTSTFPPVPEPGGFFPGDVRSSSMCIYCASTSAQLPQWGGSEGHSRNKFHGHALGAGKHGTLRCDYSITSEVAFATRVFSLVRLTDSQGNGLENQPIFTRQLYRGSTTRLAMPLAMPLAMQLAMQLAVPYAEENPARA
ncbi:hypothetical protein PZA11_002917 [Diplocarpon coronariae]